MPRHEATNAINTNAAILERLQVSTQVDLKTMRVCHNLVFRSAAGHVLGWRWSEHSLKTALMSAGLYANHGLMSYLEAAIIVKKMRELQSETVR